MAKEKNCPDKTTECEVSPSPGEVAIEAPSGGGEKETALEAEAKAAQDRFLRLAAEFENYKKRVQRDQDEYTKYAHERLLKDLLPVLDNLQRALQHVQSEGNTNGVVQGVELTCKQYLEVLSRFGVRPIPSVGLPFDPAVHQAVATVEAQGQAPNTVVEEYEKGYFLYDRVLRPAMVTVAASRPEECRDAPVKSTP
ncbi:MAG TPA: nucleotide exchange factor GrpE [Nitrospirales bacterium]|nr:nucleotide exchange factor GrpE [Nitrospirales bacterium]